MELYHQKDLVVNNRQLRYQGIFRFDELRETINIALDQKQYKKFEKKTEEIVTESGRRTYIEIRPYKEINEFAKLMIKIKITMNNVRDSIEEVKGVKRKFQSGAVQIVFDSWVLTDYQNRWRIKPILYFTQGIINKYLWPIKTEKAFSKELKSDTAYIYSQTRQLLNSYKLESGKLKSEEEIKQEIAKDIKN
tara:strand:+ start:27169 stop:27744 length:576 start_codon:yes stop_codon:yes gene_type:complete